VIGTADTDVNRLIGTSGTDGYVIVDTVRIMTLEEPSEATWLRCVEPGVAAK
jgi:hypothetical protein